MPGAWSGYEKLSPMKYQIVMNIFLLLHSDYSEDSFPAFALICQYLSSTVRDLAPSRIFDGPGNPQVSPSLKLTVL
jgi:hypothetical protein